MLALGRFLAMNRLFGMCACVVCVYVVCVYVAYMVDPANTSLADVRQMIGMYFYLCHRKPCVCSYLVFAFVYICVLFGWGVFDGAVCLCVCVCIHICVCVCAEEELDDVPDAFVFLLAGVPIGLRQEVYYTLHSWVRCSVYGSDTVMGGDVCTRMCIWCMHMCMCMCMCKCVFVLCVSAHVFMCVCVLCVCACVHMYMHVYMPMDMPMCICILCDIRENVR